MATTTPVLGLTLPANTEKVSRQVINANNSIIDGAFASVGVKVYDITVEVSNVSGSYSHSFTDSDVVSTMKAIDFYAVDPTIFNDKITVTPADGSFTIACNSVAGTTNVTITFVKSTSINSNEYDELVDMIGTLSSLTTTDDSDLVSAINEVNGKVDNVASTVETQAIINEYGS